VLRATLATDAIIGAFEQAKATKGKPTFILADTVKGKGVSFMEGKVDWHGVAPNAEQAAQAIEEISKLAKFPSENPNPVLRIARDGTVVFANIASSYLISGEIPKRWGTAHETIVPYQGFETKDKYVIVAVGNDQIWKRFCNVIDRLDLAEDPRFKTNPLRVQNRTECIGILESVMKTRTRDEWIKLLNDEAIPCAPINTMDEVFQDPQVLHRDMLVEMNHPTAGIIKLVGIPVKYSEMKATIRMPPPVLGEHTREILSGILGYDDMRIEKLKSAGVI